MMIMDTEDDSFTVYAIEASDMAHQAELVIKENSMQDRITVIHGRVEVRPVQQHNSAHIIISAMFM